MHQSCSGDVMGTVRLVGRCAAPLWNQLLDLEERRLTDRRLCGMNKRLTLGQKTSARYSAALGLVNICLFRESVFAQSKEI